MTPSTVTATSDPGAKTVVKPPLHHINLKTIRAEAMTDFYAKVIGVEVIFKNEFAVFTSNDDAHHRIVFITLDGMRNDPDKIPHTGSITLHSTTGRSRS